MSPILIRDILITEEGIDRFMNFLDRVTDNGPMILAMIVAVIYFLGIAR
jgi:hypothetical protein